MVEIDGNIAKVTKHYTLSDNELKILELMNDNTLDNITLEMFGDLKFKNKNRIYQAITRLRKKGFNIENRKGIGYRIKEIIWK